MVGDNEWPLFLYEMGSKIMDHKARAYVHGKLLLLDVYVTPFASLGWEPTHVALDSSVTWKREGRVILLKKVMRV